MGTGYDWDFSAVWLAWPLLAEGLMLTIILTVVIMALSLALGFVVAMARMSRYPWLRAITAIYVDFFRGIPPLVLVFWVFFTLPMTTGLMLTPVQTGIIALTLNITAFMSEIYRAGIQSVSFGQTQAALSLGMSPWQSLTRVILPQAARYVAPPTASQWVSLFQDTSLLSVIIVAELMYQGRLLAVQTYRPLEIYTVIALVYFFITFPQARFADYVYERLRVKG